VQRLVEVSAARWVNRDERQVGQVLGGGSRRPDAGSAVRFSDRGCRQVLDEHLGTDRREARREDLVERVDDERDDRHADHGRAGSSWPASVAEVGGLP